jgi:AraC family transcriptional regulator
MVTLPRAAPLRRIARCERIDGLVLSEFTYSPGLRLGWHSHELAAFVLTLRGTSRETFTGAEFEGTERGLLIRPAHERHWDSIGDQGASCFLIELGSIWLRGLPVLGSVLQVPSFNRSGTLRCLAHRVYREWLLNDTASPIAIQALVQEIAAQLIREEERRVMSRPPVWLRRVKQRLEEDLAETPTLTELAGIGGVHPTHLARHFRRHYAMTIGEYLRQRRVDAAMEMLSEKNCALTEIALEVGFSSHGHLCTVFKRLTGMTPSEFCETRH